MLQQATDNVEENILEVAISIITGHHMCWCRPQEKMLIHVNVHSTRRAHVAEPSLERGRAK